MVTGRKSKAPDAFADVLWLTLVLRLAIFLGASFLRQTEKSAVRDTLPPTKLTGSQTTSQELFDFAYPVLR